MFTSHTKFMLLISGSRHVRMANLFENFEENEAGGEDEGEGASESVQSTPGPEEGADTENEKDLDQVRGCHYFFLFFLHVLVCSALT